MMRVQQFERSYFLLPYHACDAGQCQFQLFGFGRRREEQASLGQARAGGLGREMNFYNGRSGRMGVEVELQQLEKNLGIEHGKRQREAANELCLTRVLYMQPPSAVRRNEVPRFLRG